jgi:hypothetical protein
MKINFYYAVLNNSLQKELKSGSDNFSDWCLFADSQAIISFVDLFRIYADNNENINDFFLRLKNHFNPKTSYNFVKEVK